MVLQIIATSGWHIPLRKTQTHPIWSLLHKAKGTTYFPLSLLLLKVRWLKLNLFL